MHHPHRAFRRTSLALALACAFAVAPALAGDQEAQGQPDAAQAAGQGTQIDTVTVTARRRAELLKDVPTAITAFTPTQLRDLNVQNLGDLQGHVPDLTVYAARGNNSTITTFIRGVGQADPVWGADPGVGLYLDDVYIARPQGGLLDVFDIQRIEVLRGPQGTLYGKNTIGGALKYVSRPLGTKTEGSVQADIGNYAQKNLKASVGTASGDGEWRMRVAYATLHRDGFGRNLVGGEPVSNQNTNAGRVSVGYFPVGVPLTVQFAADTTHDNSNERGFQRLIANKFDAAKTPMSGNRYDISSGMPDINWTHGGGVALNVSYGLNDAWTLKLIAAHRKSDTATTIDFDGVKQAIADVTGDYHDRQNTQELQAVYQGAMSSGVIGLYHFDGSAGGHIFNNFLNLQFAQTASTVFTSSKALYADWNVKVLPRLDLGAGIRYTDEEKHAVVDNEVFKDGTFSTPIAVAAKFDRRLNTSKLSPKLSAKYEATASTNVYASAARGFKSGGFNIRANTAAVPESAKPYLDEEVTTYEVGSKSSFDGGRWQLNLAAFRSNYRNMQLSVFTSYTLPNGTQGFFGDFTNAGKATIKGLEIESVWKPTANWNVSAHLSNLHASYDEYIDRGVNVAGQKWFSNAPKVQAGLNVQYTTPVSFGGTLSTRLGYTYQSKVYPTTDLSEDIAQQAYGLVGAGVVWERDRNWSFALQGSNLADKHYRTDGYNIPALGVVTGYYGPPRMITASATYRF